MTKAVTVLTESGFADLPPDVREEIGRVFRVVVGAEDVTERAMRNEIRGTFFRIKQRDLITRWVAHLLDGYHQGSEAPIYWQLGMGDPQNYTAAILGGYLDVMRIAFGDLHLADQVERSGWDAYRLAQLARVLASGCAAFQGLQARADRAEVVKRAEWLYEMCNRIEYPSVWDGDEQASLQWHMLWWAVACCLGRPIRKGVPMAWIETDAEVHARILRDGGLRRLTRLVPRWAGLFGLRGTLLVAPAPDGPANRER